MDQTENKRSAEKIVLPILAVLALLGAALSVYMASAAEGSFLSHCGGDIAMLIMYLMLLLYAVRGYQVPHGNLLRYSFFLFSVALAVTLVTGTETASLPLPLHCTELLCVVLAAYISGRLNKFEKNRILLIIVALLLLAGVVLTAVWHRGSMAVLLACSQFILWICLSIAYVLRFREHTCSGLEDK